jgi:Chitobiase/beta-hexosaminidase C-terminal domain
MKTVSGFATLLLAAFFMAFSSVPTSAQTLTLNDGAIVRSDTNRVGLNIGAIDYWDQGQILKNLIGSSNPGMEPLTQQQIWAVKEAGTTTSFTVPDIYDGVPTNYWTGGTFTIVQSQSGGAELGCTGTIASNTGPNYPLTGQSTYFAPVITVSSPCAAPFSIGDVVILSMYVFPTPESWWETGGEGGTEGTVRGGAQLLSDTTDLCATCGKQALNMNASAAGSSAQAAWYFDGEYKDNIFVLMNGTYQVSFWAKLASGTPALTVSASRGSSGGFNCGSYTPKLTSAWALYTWNCTASETQAGTTPSNAGVAFVVTGGSLYLDNVSFEKVNTNPSNTTILRDEVIDTLQTYYGTSIGSNPGTLRYWVNQNAETISNWTEPDYAHGPTGWGTGYFVGPGGGGAVVLSLEDYLELCKFLNAEPYLEVPVTLSTADAPNLIEFLGSPSTTTFGARRAALGQEEPWTSVFKKIHLSFCNECWNVYFPGQSLPARTSAPDLELYYDYSVRARDIFAAMRADSYYVSSSLDLVMDAQTAVNSTMDTAIQRAHPDSIEIEDYTYGAVSVYTPDAALWQPAMIDPWEKVTNPKDIRNFYQSLHDYQSQTTCGATGTATCNVNIYEWGQGTISGGLPQQYLDYVNAGAGEGVVMALQPLLNMQYYGIEAQSFFALSEYKNGASGGLTSKLWGNTVDMGGATNNVRPTFLGVQLINQSIIGPMYSCPIANNLTYNFPGSPNGVGPMPAMNNVPYLYAFCFENGTKRSLVLINTDLSNSHALTFGGINPPSGTVTQRQYAPSALDDMNEAPTGTATNQAPATVAIETSSLTSPSSITLPPFSVTALDYTSPGAQAAAMPTFSPAAGTYTTSQQVTISDTTPGTTIYYTTDGTTPTTSSNVFNSTAITVSASETLEAIAVETGYTTSPATTAAYTIAPVLPTPIVNPAAGTYATTQSVTFSESTPGATIYYTTDGTTPTASSNPYSSAISVSTTQTLQAIAVKAGYTNSVVDTALFTIAPALAAPTFSPAPGTYTSPESVTINETTAGALIYYTTDGTTPTASSRQYAGAIWQSTSQTLKAIAVKSGSTNSPVTTGVFTIAPVLPPPTFSPTGGGAWATYTTPQLVTISDSQPGTRFYYTTNGSTPTTSSTLYTGPFQVSVTETVQAIAVETGYTNSAPASVLYTMNCSTLATPVFNLPAGTYAIAQTVSISDASSGATIYYTTNGTAPTTSSTKYTAPITVSATEKLNAIAIETGYTSSGVATAAYTINSEVPAPTFSPAGGTYPTAQTVTISETTLGTTIYYTTNGTTPTTSSARYTGPITVTSTETLEAIAFETGDSNAVGMATFTIVPKSAAVLTVPTPGSTFTGTSATFAWTPVTTATGYILSVGTTGVGSYNLYYSGSVTAPSATVNNLPTNGAPIYVRLTTNFNGTWVHSDSTYTAATQAALTSPTPSITLTGSGVTFTWTTAPAATGYILSLGTTGAGSYDLYYSGSVTVDSATVNNLPTNGATIYARLTTNFNGIWVHTDYTYTAQ